MRLEGCRHTSEPNIFWVWVARDPTMGLAKRRYIWRYVAAANIKNTIKTVGYGICSVEPVATTFYLRASQIIRNFQFSLIKIRLSNSMKTCQTSWRCPGYRFCDFAFRGRCLRFQHLAKLSVLLRRILLQTTLRDYSRLWALPPRARPNLYR